MSGTHEMVREANSIVMLMCLFSPAVPAEGPSAKATGRLARRAQQDPAARRPVRGDIEQRVDHRGTQRRPGRGEPKRSDSGGVAGRYKKDGVAR